MARQLGRSKFTVLIGARNSELGQAAVATLKSESVDAQYVELDVVRLTTIEAAASRIARGFKRLDVLVNNAGINDAVMGCPARSISVLSAELWRPIFLER